MKRSKCTYPIIIIKHVVIGTETVLVSSTVLCDDDDVDASQLLRIFGSFASLDVDVTELRSSELKSSCERNSNQVCCFSSITLKLTSLSKSFNSLVIARIFRRVRISRRFATPGQMRHKHTLA